MSMIDVTNGMQRGNSEKAGKIFEYEGLSGDEKPVLTVENNGSTCFVIDEAELYIWHNDSWLLPGELLD